MPALGSMKLGGETAENIKKKRDTYQGKEDNKQWKLFCGKVPKHESIMSKKIRGFYKRC